MGNCYLCSDELTKSYFLRVTEIEKGGFGDLVEVCPECHHHFKYSPPDILLEYINNKNINMRGMKI